MNPFVIYWERKRLSNTAFWKWQGAYTFVQPRVKNTKDIVCWSYLYKYN